MGLLVCCLLGCGDLVRVGGFILGCDGIFGLAMLRSGLYWFWFDGCLLIGLVTTLVGGCD